MENFDTCIDVIRLPWPDGTTLVTELVYRISPDGEVSNKALSPEALEALQALTDYRQPMGERRGNSLEEMSEEEEQLFDTLAFALLTPAQRRTHAALTLVKEFHRPVAFSSDFGLGEIETLEDGSGQIEVIEAGPNWSTRYTLYQLTLEPEVSILAMYTPFGEHSFNHHFQITEKSPDESNRWDNFPAWLAQLWKKPIWTEGPEPWLQIGDIHVTHKEGVYLIWERRIEHAGVNPIWFPIWDGRSMADLEAYLQGWHKIKESENPTGAAYCGFYRRQETAAGPE